MCRQSHVDRPSSAPHPSVLHLGESGGTDHRELVAPYHGDTFRYNVLPRLRCAIASKQAGLQMSELQLERCSNGRTNCTCRHGLVSRTQPTVGLITFRMYIQRHADLEASQAGPGPGPAASTWAPAKYAGSALPSPFKPPAY